MSRIKSVLAADSSDELLWPYLKRIRDPNQIQQTDVCLSPFNLSHITSVQTGTSRKFLLRELHAQAITPHSLAKR
jgi:hypothetical protein